MYCITLYIHTYIILHTDNYLYEHGVMAANNIYFASRVHFIIHNVHNTISNILHLEKCVFMKTIDESLLYTYIICLCVCVFNYISSEIETIP